jgi:hypothetical protein
MIDASRGVRRFNMTVDIRKRHFSGILLVREMEKGRYRLAFSAHFGLSLFDYEITPAAIEVRHSLEALAGKRVTRLLHRDFSILLALNLEAKNPAIRYTSPTDTLYRLTKSPARGYYRKTTAHLTHIQTGTALNKTTYQKPSPHTILITHPPLHLTIGIKETGKDSEYSGKGMTAHPPCDR